MFSYPSIYTESISLEDGSSLSLTSSTFPKNHYTLFYRKQGKRIICKSYDVLESETLFLQRRDNYILVYKRLSQPMEVLEDYFLLDDLNRKIENGVEKKKSLQKK